MYTIFRAMNLRILLNAALGTLGCLVLVVGPVSADITLIERTTIDMTSLQGASSSMMSIFRPSGNGVLELKVYVSGHKCRFESPYLVVIADRDAAKTWMLNTTSLKYAVRPYDANTIAGVQAGALSIADLAHLDIHATVTDTGRTASIMGHTARHYKVTIDRKFRDTQTTFSSDILAAEDLTPANLDAWSEANVTIYGPNLRGVPLLTETEALGTSSHAAITRVIATSISTDAIPENMFSIPDGYTKVIDQELFAPATH